MADTPDIQSVVDEAGRAFATDPAYLIDLARQGAQALARKDAKSTNSRMGHPLQSAA